MPSILTSRSAAKRIPRGIIVVLSAFLALSAGAHEPTEPFANWFNALAMPKSGIGCCGMHHDCEYTDAVLKDDGWWALWQNPYGPWQWIKVPEDRTLHQDNPTGQAVLCANPVGTVLCFVPIAET